MPKEAPRLTRDDKVENLVFNFSMIMMGMFEGVFADLASGMASALTRTADALTEALDSGQGVHATAPKVGVDSQVNSKIKDMFSGLRKEVAEEFSGKGPKFKEFIKDPAFDAGVRIVEGHRLKLPSLTERLSDSDLAGYVALIQEGDPEMAKLMAELGKWQMSTPHFDG